MSQEMPAVGRIYRLKSKATGFYPYLYGEGGDETPLRALDEGQLQQFGGYAEWRIVASDIGIRLENAGRPGEMMDSNAEQKVYVMPSNDGSYQKWQLRPDGEGYFQLVNLATGFALDGNADKEMYTMGPNDGAYQRWKFIPA